MFNIELLTFLSTSLADRMREAGLNTIIGMVVVFVVLVIIAFIIYLFKYIPDGSDKKIKQDESKQEVQKTQQAKLVKSKSRAKTSQDVVQDAGDQNLTNDSELVAVITAAIMASMSEEGIEVPEDGLIIRSIRRKTTYR